MTSSQLLSGEAMVALQGLTRRFDGLPAIDDVSLAVHKGEFVSILGPSGCGKSTLLRILAGFDRPDAGRVFINGRDMEGVPPFQRDTAVVVQHFALFPHMSVLGNVEFGLEMRRVKASTRRREVLDMLEQVGLLGMADRMVDQLSGGQRQRVALARALVTRPGVLLLDEPLGALDANLRVKMQGELKRLNKRLGITFLLVTGNQSEAMAMSDRLVVMNQGRVEQLGTPQQVFRSPATAFVAQFMGNFNVLRGRVQATEGRIARVETSAGLLHATIQGTPPASGSGCSLLVRSDLPQMGNGFPDGEPVNQISGQVTELEFTGSMLTCLVGLPGGEVFKVQKHRSVEKTLTANVEHGAGVTVAWPVEQTRLLLDSEVEARGRQDH